MCLFPFHVDLKLLFFLERGGKVEFLVLFWFIGMREGGNPGAVIGGQLFNKIRLQFTLGKDGFMQLIYRQLWSRMPKNVHSFVAFRFKPQLASVELGSVEEGCSDSPTWTEWRNVNARECDCRCGVDKTFLFEEKTVASWTRVGPTAGDHGDLMGSWWYSQQKFPFGNLSWSWLELTNLIGRPGDFLAAGKSDFQTICIEFGNCTQPHT